jgi:hypothetical protein
MIIELLLLLLLVVVLVLVLVLEKLEKLCLQSLRKRRQHFDALFCSGLLWF